MSRPGGPYRDEQYPPRRQPQQRYPDQGQPQDDYQRGYPDQGHQDPGYGGQRYADQGYADPRYDRGGYADQGPPNQGYDRGGYADQGYDRGGYADQGYADQGYDRGGYDQDYQPAPQRPASQRPSPERRTPPSDYDEYRGDDDRGGFHLPGLGLVLSIIGLVVQVVSFTVLPWMVSAGNKDSQALPAIWDLAKNFDARGFAGAYVVLFSYPLAVLGILLSLVAVLESVAMKVIWAALAIIGVGVLAVKYGLGDLFSGGGFHPDRRELTFGIIALGVLVVVIFMLKMAMSTFRRLAGLVLLAIAGVHVYAVSDLSDGFGLQDVQLGAYGPALGYAIAAVAAFIGPRKIA